MKNYTIYLKKYAFPAVAVLTLALAGCVKNNINNPGGEDRLPVFDFSTKSVYTLDVQYDVPDGYNVYFEVYTQNPLNIDNEGGQITKRSDIEPIDKGFTDAKGNYKQPVKVPSFVSGLYIYTPDAGVPQLLYCRIKDGVLSRAGELSRENTQASASAVKSAKAGNLVKMVDIPGVTSRILGSWEHYANGYATLPNAGLYNNQARLWGRPDYLTYIRQVSFPGQSGLPMLTVPSNVWKTINTVLPGDGKGEVDPKVLKNGDIHVTEEAEVDLYFIGQECLYMNTLAYYCYETANPPAAPADIKVQTIAFPNATEIADHGTYWPGTMVRDYGALFKGEGVRLHYFDKDGIDRGTKFPAGISIGWILYSNGYNVTRYPFGAVESGYGPIYSNKNLMNGIPHVAVFRHGDFVVTGFEDTRKMAAGDSRDYRDLMFHVASTPTGAITPEIPDVDPEQPSDAEVNYYGILTFEDLWPAQGDFDMNDVVIKYASTVIYNKNNQVTGTRNQYTVLWSGADLDNSFAYVDNNMKGAATVTFEGGDGNSSADMANNIIRVARKLKAYANGDTKLTFTVHTKYSSPVAKSSFIFPPYNPFITVNSVDGREVHLTNQAPSPVADLSLLGTLDDKSVPQEGKYYITYDAGSQQMPFAIDIVFNSEAEAGKFIIPDEKERINIRYPDFLQWVRSGGKEKTDWYLNPRKN